MRTLKMTYKKIFIIVGCLALFFSASEYVYRVFFLIPYSRSLVELYLINLLLISIFIFSKYKLTKVFIWLFFTLSIIVNNIHYEVYKSWVTSINYLLAVTEVSEATHVGINMWQKLLVPFLWGLMESLLFCSLFFVKTKKTYRIVDFIFIVSILFICGRSFHSTQQHGISPNPDYSRIKANYFSFGHFIGKILPYHLFGLSDIPYYLESEPNVLTPPKIKNIIFVVGESQNIQHMGVFGYARDTTPFLSSLANNNAALIKPTYSGGLMTAIALPTLFNAIKKPNGMLQITRGDTNLFNLAKKQNFYNQFYSAQAEKEMMIMNIIGSRWIDNLVFPTKLGYNFTENMPDFNLLPYLKKIDLDNAQNNFVILHQRGSHQPFGILLEPNDNIFGTETNIDKYDNTIHKTDQLLNKVYDFLNKRNKDDWILIFTSDHGQHVTKNATNQGTFSLDSYSVPTFIYTPNKEVQLEIQKYFKNCDHLFHQQIATFLISLMGYDLPISKCDIGYVNGNLLSGDIGYLEINQEKNEVKQLK